MGSDPDNVERAAELLRSAGLRPPVTGLYSRGEDVVVVTVKEGLTEDEADRITSALHAIPHRIVRHPIEPAIHYNGGADTDHDEA